MLRSNSKQSGESCSQSRRRKGKAAVGRICRKGRFHAWNERLQQSSTVIEREEFACHVTQQQHINKQVH